MISAKSKIFILALLACTLLSCKTFSRLINKGGNIFTVEIQTDEPNKAEIIERAINVTQNKINAVGLDGEVEKIPDHDNRISVKLYGANDLKKIKKFLFTTYQLELKKAVSPPYPTPLQTYPTKEAAAKVATAEQEVLPYSEISEDLSDKFVIVEKKAIINGEDIRDASPYSPTQSADNYSISFSLKPEGATKFGDWTSKNILNYLAIVLDKKVQSAPYIRNQIKDAGVIDGRFTKESAQEIALSLKSGYLPATMKVLEEKTF